MKDNTRTAIGYICIAFCVISYFLFMAVALAPREFTLNFGMDDNALEMMEIANNISMNQEKVKVCYAITNEVYAVWNVQDNIIYNKTIDKGSEWQKVICPDEFASRSVEE